MKLIQAWTGQSDALRAESDWLGGVVLSEGGARGGDAGGGGASTDPQRGVEVEGGASRAAPRGGGPTEGR